MRSGTSPVNRLKGPVPSLVSVERYPGGTMGWGPELAFRDCPWCGLRDAQMTPILVDAAAGRPNGLPRTWSAVSCPRCAGVVLLETNDPNNTPPKVEMTIPEDERAGSQVGHLPEDVARFYADAQRVLDANVPDAVAVQLRKTLEAAAAHFEIDSGPLVARIEKLIEEGLITKQFGEVLDSVRKLGNIGAHASDVTVDEESAKRALRFTTQVLRNLFEIPAELNPETSEDEPQP